MIERPQDLGDDVTIVDGPRRVGSELRWAVTTATGAGVLAQLAPELAGDPAVRTRWVADTRRMVELEAAAHCRPLRVGPAPDPADLAAPPPWRLRRQPPGVGLDAWLSVHAPAPIDQVVGLLVAICTAIAEVHAAGAVIRDLAPRNLVVDGDAVWLVDIGLSRTDILSSRTAASLLLDDSPYLAPELLRRTSVDRRADVYSVGVIAYVALCGVPPWGGHGAIARPGGQPPGVRTLRSAVPPALERLVDACLAEDPAARPDSLLAVRDALEGRPAEPGARARIACQACGAAMRLGQRLCLQCGRTVVQFHHAAPDTPGTAALVLTRAREDATFMAGLRSALGAVAAGELPQLNILVGDERMYSKREREQLLRLPLRLFDRLAPDTALALRAHLARAGVDTKVMPSQPKRSASAAVPAAITAAGVAATIGMFVLGMPILGGMILTVALVAAIVVARVRRRTLPQREALLRLRAAPLALPASDPWVRRLAALLGPTTAADVREQVGALALAVQQLVDHRVEHQRERAAIDMVTAPVDRLVDLIEREVIAIAELDAELRTLDEGELVRGIARSEARREPTGARVALLAGLERLRAVEDTRARAIHRLLDAGALLRRAVAMGLRVHDDAAEHERWLAASLQALEHTPAPPALAPGALNVESPGGGGDRTC